MANIYELKQEFDTLWSILEDELVEDAELEDAFANAQLDLADKLENCCKYIKNQESAIAGLKEEEKRLSTKRKAMENGIERLKKLMQMAMTAAGEKKIACGTFTTSIQANPPKAVIDTDLANIPEKYLVAQEPTIDKKAILAYRWVYIFAIFIGPYLTVSAVWTSADIFNGLMAFPNLIALILLSGIVANETKTFLAKFKGDKE